MSRSAVAAAAVRAVALLFLAGALVSGTGLLLLLSRPVDVRGRVAPGFGLAVTGVVVSLALSGLLWGTAPALGRRIFRDGPDDRVVDSSDLYRIASAFAGLILLSQSIPAFAAFLARWWFAYSATASVFGPIGFDAVDRAALFGVEAKAGAVTTVVQAALGATLLCAGKNVEWLLQRVRDEEPS